MKPKSKRITKIKQTLPKKRLKTGKTLKAINYKIEKKEVLPFEYHMKKK